MEAEEKSAEGLAEGDPGTSEEIEAAPSENPSRMLIFNTLVDKFLDGLVQAGSYQRFARCYKRFYKLQPEMTRSIYDQFVFQLQTSIRDEIQEIRDEGNLEALLDSLDKMEKEAGDRTELAWRPSGVPEQDLRSHLVPYLLQQRDYLHKLLKEREEENKRLAQTVLLGRRKIQEMQKEIETRKQAWQELSKAQRELILSVEEPK